MTVKHDHSTRLESAVHRAEAMPEQAAVLSWIAIGGHQILDIAGSNRSV